MTDTTNHEFVGADMAHECLDSILNSTDQALACCSLLGLLNSISGCSEEAKGARRGTAAVLVDVIKRGLEAIRTDKGA